MAIGKIQGEALEGIAIETQQRRLCIQGQLMSSPLIGSTKRPSLIHLHR